MDHVIQLWYRILPYFLYITLLIVRQKSFDDETIDMVWSKAREIPNQDPGVAGQDACGTPMIKDDYGTNKFSYVSANWKITEIMLFLKRLYTKILDVNDVVDIQISMVGCKDRHFSSDGGEYGVPWEFEFVKCDENNIILKKSVNSSTLKASWQDIAVEFTHI